MWRVGVVALPQFSKFILGKRDEGRAPDDAQRTNDALTNRLEHPRLGDVQQARQLARAQECQVVAGSWNVYGHVPSCRCQRAHAG